MKTKLAGLITVILLSILLAFLSNNFAKGADFQSGQTIDGYAYHDGFWWKSELPYTLSRTPIYDSYGRCVVRYRNSFSRAPMYRDPPIYHVPAKTIIQKETYVPPTKAEKPPKGWRERLLEIKEAQLAFQQKQQDAIRDHKEYIEAIDALGLNDPQSAPVNSAYGYKLSQYSHAYNPLAQQGNTLYGYSLNTLAQSYGQPDVNVWMQQYSRGIDNAQKSADKGLSGILSAIQTEGSNRQRVAELLALKALVETLNVPETTTKTDIEVTGTGVGGNTYTPPAGLQAQSYQALLPQAFARSCYKCHSPNGVQGVSGKSDLFPNGVDLTQYTKFSPQQKEAVFQSVKTGSMPKGNGPSLNPIEQALLYADVEAAKN